MVAGSISTRPINLVSLAFELVLRFLSASHTMNKKKVLVTTNYYYKSYIYTDRHTNYTHKQIYLICIYIYQLNIHLIYIYISIEYTCRDGRIFYFILRIFFLEILRLHVSISVIF